MTKKIRIMEDITFALHTPKDFRFHSTFKENWLLKMKVMFSDKNIFFSDGTMY